MAVIDGTNITADYSMFLTSQSNFASYVSHSSTNYTYLTTGGVSITLTGTGFTVDGSNIPNGGTVTGITIDIGNDGGLPDLDITDISIAATAFIYDSSVEASQIFWGEILAGETSIIYGDGAFLTLIGDYLDSPANAFSVASDDIFTGEARTLGRLYGDAQAIEVQFLAVTISL